MKRRETVNPKAAERIRLDLAELTRRLTLSSFSEAAKNALIMTIINNQLVFLSLNELALHGLSEQLDESLQAIEETFIAIHRSGKHPGKVIEMTLTNEELHHRLGIIQGNAKKLIPTPTAEPMSTATISTSTATSSTTAAVISKMEKPSQPNEDDGDYAVAMALIAEDDADAVAAAPQPPLKELAIRPAAAHHSISNHDRQATAAGDSFINNNSVSLCSANNDLAPVANHQNAPSRLPPAAIPRPKEHRTPGEPVVPQAIPSTCPEVLRLFEDTYKPERNQPNQYRNNDGLAAPEAAQIIRLTQKNYAFYLLEELANVNPSPIFYVAGRLAPENSVLRINENLGGFSRIEGVFIQFGDTTLYMTLGGISTPSYMTQPETAWKNLAQDAPNFGELCQSGVLELIGSFNRLSFVPSDFGLATSKESTMTDELRETLKALIESAGEKTTTHMAAITKRLARDKQRAEEEKERIQKALAEDPNDPRRQAAFKQAQEQSARAASAHQSVTHSIQNSVNSAHNSLSANPIPYRAGGMPIRPPAAMPRLGAPEMGGLFRAPPPGGGGGGVAGQGGGGLPRASWDPTHAIRNQPPF